VVLSVEAVRRLSSAAQPGKRICRNFGSRQAASSY